ncbi:MAG: gamma-glutamyltransferase [Bacteroidetes bacterium]|jgi:gamma-glutamyltranspeptidase/glutathione hydrolase|nr:gamma-glutamyltransferase [Bacteroidota bacterium]
MYTVMPLPKGVIAAGHPATAEVAAQVLRDGGNAFDAVIAAQCMAFVAEPVLTSPGGGGFLMAETAGGKQTLYDFFVQTPGRKKKASDLSFFPISADFGEARQEYHVGPGSIAVPGMVKGLFRVHRDLCTLPLKRLASPAIERAREGMEVNRFQARLFEIVRPIYTSSLEALRIFKSSQLNHDIVRPGEILKQPELANFLEKLVQQGEACFYDGEIARAITRICSMDGGHITREDLQNYNVVLRKPLMINFKNHSIAINPPPSTGGILTGFALELMKSIDADDLPFGSELYLATLVELQKLTNKARMDGVAGSGGSRQGILDPFFLEAYKKEILGRYASFKGTTQISIADRDGNLASLTSSNGEGSGVMIPGTGVMLNNMLGEQDLNPAGFHSWQPDKRLTSMMAPGLLRMADGQRVVFGSGGSNRIRTAILQVLLNLMEFQLPLEEAVNAPRIHYEQAELNVEGGFESAHLNKIKESCSRHKIWKEKALYFGGAHSVSTGPRGVKGAGDGRRGGVSVIV